MEQKKPSTNSKNSLNQNRNDSHADVSILKDLLTESEAWLELDWVKEKLNKRWQSQLDSDFEVFHL